VAPGGDQARLEHGLSLRGSAGRQNAGAGGLEVAHFVQRDKAFCQDPRVFGFGLSLAEGELVLPSHDLELHRGLVGRDGCVPRRSSTATARVLWQNRAPHQVPVRSHVEVVEIGVAEGILVPLLLFGCGAIGAPRGFGVHGVFAGAVLGHARLVGLNKVGVMMRRRSG
jgi:hypothetical protein